MLRKKNGPQLLAPLSWTVSSSLSSSGGGLGASTAPGQCSFFRATLLQTLEPSPSCSYVFVRVPGCLGLDFFSPPSISSRVVEAFVLPPSPWIWQAAFKAHTSAPVT